MEKVKIKWKKIFSTSFQMITDYNALHILRLKKIKTRIHTNNFSNQYIADTKRILGQ